MKKQNFLDWNYKILLDSLGKIDFSIILIAVLDALFYLSSIFPYLYWFKSINAKQESLRLPADPSLLPINELQKLVAEGQTFFYFLVFSSILVTLIIILLASIIKGIIWAKTTRTKITLKLISKFFILNLAWMGFWFLVIAAIAYFVETYSVNLFSRIAIFLAIYFTGTLYSLFMKEQKFKSIIDAIKLNIAKIHLFVLPYALISLVLYITIKLTALLTFQYASFVSSTIILLYLAFVRYYVSELVFGIEKQ